MRKTNTHPKQVLTERIAIQGYPGSFHEEAAIRYFGKSVSVLPCDTFTELIQVAERSAYCNGAVMAIENSIAGSILPNYNLLHRSKLVIVGEIYLRIRQHLLALPATSIRDIRSVHSHTMALQQCLEFLSEHRWKQVETADTAKSAQELSQQRSKSTAVIASRQAAEQYGLQILAANIHTVKNNYTRFLVLKRKKEARAPDENSNKASLLFHTDHRQGALARVLNRIADQGVNLSKLQSFPIPGTEFNYAFHADLEFDRPDHFEKTLVALTPVIKKLRVYGTYKKGIWQ
ncbi:MAG: prephenate dehydratase [Bacteroidota bacterium]